MLDRRKKHLKPLIQLTTYVVFKSSLSLRTLETENGREVGLSPSEHTQSCWFSQVGGSGPQGTVSTQEKAGAENKCVQGQAVPTRDKLVPVHQGHPGLSLIQLLPE